MLNYGLGNLKDSYLPNATWVSIETWHTGCLYDLLPHCQMAAWDLSRFGKYSDPNVVFRGLTLQVEDTFLPNGACDSIETWHTEGLYHVLPYCQMATWDLSRFRKYSDPKVELWRFQWKLARYFSPKRRMRFNWNLAHWRPVPRATILPNGGVRPL